MKKKVFLLYQEILKSHKTITIFQVWWLLRIVFSAYVALLHRQPMPYQHIIIFWVNLIKAPNKLISHSTIWIELTWPARSLLQEADSWSTFLFSNWDHNPTTLSTSTYGLGLGNESKLTAHITSLTLMASCCFNKSPYLHKMTTKPEVCHLVFGL